MSGSKKHDTRDLAHLTSLNDPIEAQVIENLLDDNGIRHVFETWHSTPYDGIFEGQLGYGELKVFKDDLKRAQALLTDFRRAEVEVDDDQETEESAEL